MGSVLENQRFILVEKPGAMQKRSCLLLLAHSFFFIIFFYLISFCSYSAKGKIQSEPSLRTKYKRFAGVPCCAGKKHQLIDPPCHFTFSQDFTALNVFVCKDPKAGVNMIEVLHRERKSNVSFKGKRCACGRSRSRIRRRRF